MPSAERLSSKFHSFPPSFASRPVVHFSDNLAALSIILQYSNKLDRGLFVLKPSDSPNNFSKPTHEDRSCTFHGFFRVSLC